MSDLVHVYMSDELESLEETVKLLETEVVKEYEESIIFFRNEIQKCLKVSDTDMKRLCSLQRSLNSVFMKGVGFEENLTKFQITS